MSNALLSKLRRTVQKEKEVVDIALSRSSRSSSISEANSSICVEEGGSVLSGGYSGPTTRDDDVRSEISFMSNLASASESESQHEGSLGPRRRVLPPPPIHVGGALPVVIGEDEFTSHHVYLNCLFTQFLLVTSYPLLCETSSALSELFCS